MPLNKILMTSLGQSVKIAYVVTSVTPHQLEGVYQCKDCGRSYKHGRTLHFHLRYECNKDPQFACPVCPYKCKQRGNFRRHMVVRHAELVYSTPLDNK
ncbi:hypothetical protein J6590_014730 [Homalodisca vitripennis]|nr:hypothetical protein J6590_014730 [Homalodisca vitripennis]